MPEQQKAPDDGVYTLDGKRFRARMGVLMPPGAVYEGSVPAETPKSKGKGGKKPAATTASPGPEETTKGSGPAETE